MISRTLKEDLPVVTDAEIGTGNGHVVLVLYGEGVGQKVEITKVAIAPDVADRLTEALEDAAHSLRLAATDIQPDTLR